MAMALKKKKKQLNGRRIEAAAVNDVRIDRAITLGCALWTVYSAR